MSRNWSAVLLLGITVALSWFDSAATLKSWDPRSRPASWASGEGPPPPPGALVQVGGEFLTRDEVAAFAAMPEVLESAWAELFDVAEVQSEADLARAARLCAAVRLVAREAEQRPSLVRRVEEQLTQAERPWLMEAAEEAILDSTTPPTPDEVRQEYLRRLPLYTRPETRTCRHIYVSSQPSDPARRKKSAAARLAEVAKRLEAGQDFRQLVHEYSDSPSVENEGVLENLRPEDVLEEFADALWGLEVGEISAPVKVGEDYHLIHLLAIQATEVEPFEVHAAELAEELTAARRGEARRQALAQAEATVGAVFHPQALAPDAPADALLYRVRERIKSGGDVGRWRENLSLEEIERYNDAESRQRYFREEYERELLVEYARLVGLDKRPGLVVRRRALRQLRLAEAFMAPLIEARAAAAPAPEGTLRNHHEEHRGSFITPLKVGLEQIHVSWSGLSGDSEEVRIAAAAERAGQITAKLAEGAAPRDFSETAGVVVSRRPLQEFDQLPAILRELLSPDLQYSPLPVLEAAPGALYGPVRAGEYFLIVRLAEVQPARAMDFEECRAAVEADYRRSLEPALLKYELDARLSAAGFRFLVPLPGPA